LLFFRLHTYAQFLRLFEVALLMRPGAAARLQLAGPCC